MRKQPCGVPVIDGYCMFLCECFFPQDTQIWKNEEWYVSICDVHTSYTCIHVPLVFTTYTIGERLILSCTSLYRYKSGMIHIHLHISLLISSTSSHFDTHCSSEIWITKFYLTMLLYRQMYTTLHDMYLLHSLHLAAITETVGHGEGKNQNEK